MTAASGLIHEEFHSADYAKRGGPFEMIQLWVNLPKKDKMTNPKYQAITKDRIPEIELPDSSGIVRIIAGSFHGQTGPASTFTPMNIWDVRMKQNSSHVFTVEENQTTSVFVLSGEIKTSDGSIVREAELGVFETSKDQFQIQANQDSKLLFLIGAPLDEYQRRNSPSHDGLSDR
jgi:redox-sensitive bicupin YhaK (pirin superfamily)